MNNLAEAIAEVFYNAKKDMEFRRITFSKTSLKPPTWKGCAPKERLEWIESARQVMANEEIIQALANRAAGL